MMRTTRLRLSGPIALAALAASPALASSQALITELGLGIDPPATGQGTTQATWELPAVVVEGKPGSSLREEDLVGPYAQPRWTTSRLFAATRLYVLPERAVNIGFDTVATINRDSDGGGTDWLFAERVDVGLPHRLQLGATLQQDRDSDTGVISGSGVFDLRWALDDWNAIWGNPTLAVEYGTYADGPEHFSPSVLLAGDAGEGWHWGANALVDFELSGAKETEYAITGGLSHTVIDQQLSLGVESVFSMTDADGSRGDFDTEWLLGPSMRWLPMRQLSVQFAPLIGATDDSPNAEVHLSLEWVF